MTLAERRRSETRSGLLPEARHLVLPEGIASSGFPAVRETCRAIGIEFDGWQQDLNKCLLAKRRDGLYAADTAVLSIPRQVGKTFDVGAVAFALCIINPGLTVVWTAHRFKVSRETFNEMRGWCRRQELLPHVDEKEITTAAGNECIPFRNGSRIVFAARERGAVRGFTKVGTLVLDEAQILSEAALSDLIPTTNQAPNPLIILMGTPPKPGDPAEVFSRLRDDALKGESDDVLYVELSAEQGCDPDDRVAWHAANPSFPARTSVKAILRMRKLLNDADFLREALGVWDDVAGGPISLKAWAALTADRRMPDRATPAFFVEVSPQNRSAAIAVTFRDEDDVPHVELAEYDAGTEWLIPRLLDLAGKHRAATFAVSATGAIGGLLPELSKQGLDIPKEAQFSNTEMGRACVQLQKLVDDRMLTHSGDPLFRTALTRGVIRPFGVGLWSWEHRRSPVDISPLVAITGALWAEANLSVPMIF